MILDYYLPPEIVHIIYKQVHKMFMNDIIHEINDEYFNRYEYQVWILNPSDAFEPPIIVNNLGYKPTINERHNRLA